MTRLRHVLVLLILVLPLFTIAPVSLAGVNLTRAELKTAGTSIPAEFTHETLRVAVYAESNTTLPSYAEGGVYTDYHTNVIAMLQNKGFAATALTTRDILDHKLMASRYDVLVLPNQLPRDEIIYLVEDFWLAGGGVLSFDGSFGYLLYMGMIHSSLQGDFGLVGYGPSPYYWYDIPYTNNINVTERFPVTKSYHVDDALSFNANATVWNEGDLSSLIGSALHVLAIDGDHSGNGAIGAFDNPSRGGRIVQIPGNCSSFTAWQEQIAQDAIDWLTPRPKARVAFDFSKTPYYGVDAWDENVSHAPRYAVWRDYMVNHSFTVDKLYPPASGALTASDLALFDVLIIDLPEYTYSATEISNVIRPFVTNGGGLFYLTDYNFINPDGHENMNELIAPWGFNITDLYSSMSAFTTSDFDAHPILEGISSIDIAGGEWVNISGDAYSIIREGPNIAVAGCDVGSGRVIVSGDINFLDYDNIASNGNSIFAVNVINWLSSGTAKVLVYADYSSSAHPNYIPLRGPVAQALNDLGIPFYMTFSISYFNMSLFLDDWDMIVFDNTNYGTTAYQQRLVDFITNGGKMVFSTWHLLESAGDYFGVSVTDTLGTMQSIHITQPTSPIFNLPAHYGASTINTTLDLGFTVDALNLSIYDNASVLAGYTEHPGASITIGVDGRVIVNGALLTIYNEDTDDSTYADNLEIWENEIGFLYFDRPTINHPDDVTYMETETGNEIVWTAATDAGGWQYVLRVNGSIVTTSSWDGSDIAIGVDGLNASVYEYKLTVYDRLGYSVFDTVIVNVTEYIGPPPLGFDPTLLIIIGAAVVAVVVIIVVFMRRSKAK